ncbi:MAG: acyl-CoA thioesterase [Deltaproteobacteria bacterium]|nr:acyl-CoA thioesterase [Deltaproteobacteria bacterium]MBW2048491.1 acyl-CoA thioesterase [Deltaproteobacteria bacterium]MBW2111076.1 acyl-CoA thioesterase [Deltaproteobacteria bacterium]MBW2354682.1 acyl-CoA thioesterase [Deltaproteobacteria bacterium]
MRENLVERKIMWGDLDPLGIVFYPRYYEWIDASGHLFFEAVGLHLGDLWNKRQILFGLVKTWCDYHRPGRYHQRITISTRVDLVSQKTVTLKHLIKDTPSGVLLVEGYEKRICLDVSDPGNFRAIHIPDDILKILRDTMNVG